MDVTIRNPAAPAKSWTGRFLVDTGAFNSLAPRRHLQAIGLEPKSHDEYVLADGTALTMDTTVAQIEFEGKTVGGTVIFGDAEAEPLLGVTALESGGFEVDPRSQQLKRLPAILLKGVRGSGPAAPARHHGPIDVFATGVPW